MARAMTEDELLAAITDAATLLGWRWHHIRRSDQALQQGHRGFPDLVLAKGKRVYFLELKGPKGRVAEDQAKWLEALPWAYTIRPADLDMVLAALRAEDPLTEAELGLEGLGGHRGRDGGRCRCALGVLATAKASVRKP